MDKEPINLTYAIANSNPSHQAPRSPHEIIRFEAMDICRGVLSKQTDPKKKKKQKQKQKLLESKPLNLQAKTLSTLKKCLNNL